MEVGSEEVGAVGVCFDGVGADRVGSEVASVYFLIIAQFRGDLLMCVKSSLEECTGKEIIYLTQNFRSLIDDGVTSFLVTPGNTYV